MSELWIFTAAVFSHWVASMSGVVAIGVGIIQYIRQTKFSPSIWIALGIGCLFIASYQAWSDEHEARVKVEQSEQQNQKRPAMKNLLSTAINEGEALNKEWFKRTDVDAYLHEANVWTNKTGHLINDAYGEGELAVWMSNAGIISFADPNKPTTKTNSWIVNRLQRLNELMIRVDILPMQPGFDPNHYRWVAECVDCIP
jgi:hypothetical protein